MKGKMEKLSTEAKRIKNTKQNKQKETQHPTLVTKSG